MYEFLTKGEHFITIRDRSGKPPIRRRYWNNNVISKILQNQSESEDIFVTKYSTAKLVQYIILDFDSKEDKSIALKESERLMNFFENNGHPCVLVDSTSKGYHLYAKISPVLFDDDGNWSFNWKLFFEGFVRFFINHSTRKPYTTLDETNTSAGLTGNIRLIGSIHPTTKKKVEIIHGEFNEEVLPPTELQSEALKFAYDFCEICETVKKKRKVNKTKVVNTYDPIEENDLRLIFPKIFGGDIKHYENYSMMCCPFHYEKHPSLMLGKEWFKCLACGEKGNIWTLRKKGLVEFGIDGKAMY